MALADGASLSNTWTRVVQPISHVLKYPKHDEATIALVRAAVEHPGGCSSVHMATLLLRNASAHNNRVAIYNMNKRMVPELSYFDAVDGLDPEGTLRTWRELGIKFISNNPKTRRSFGQFACTLTKLRALLWQHLHEVPLMLTLEDDVFIRNVSAFREILCFGASYLDSQQRWTARSAGADCGRFNAVRFGDLGEAYLTPLWGARRILRAFCESGIDDNADFKINKHIPGILWLSAHQAQKGSLSLARPSGQGYISKTGHDLNDTALRAESAGWPIPAWCAPDWRPRCET